MQIKVDGKIMHFVYLSKYLYKVDHMLPFAFLMKEGIFCLVRKLIVDNSRIILHRTNEKAVFSDYFRTNVQCLYVLEDTEIFKALEII